MSIKDSDFLDLAKAILTPEANEIAIRCAISRAYYSAYHTAKNYHGQLTSPGSAPAGNYGDHELLIQQLSNPTIMKGSDYWKSKSVGFKLRTLKIKRGKCDYDLHLNIGRTDAVQQIAETEELFAKISE